MSRLVGHRSAIFTGVSHIRSPFTDSIQRLKTIFLRQLNTIHKYETPDVNLWIPHCSFHLSNFTFEIEKLIITAQFLPNEQMINAS